LTHEKLEGAFQGFDIDHSNSVSFDEIKNFLFASKGFDEEYLRHVMMSVSKNTNENGEISLEQFKDLMFQLLT